MMKKEVGKMKIRKNSKPQNITFFMRLDLPRAQFIIINCNFPDRAYDNIIGRQRILIGL
jgi:hypothetical protein